MESIDLIKYKYNLNSHVVKNSLIQKICEKIQQIPKFQELNNPNVHTEIILFVCNIIENCVRKKDRINKKEIVLDVFKEIKFIKKDDDVTHVTNIIEFLHSNHRIKKLKYYRKIYLLSIDWIKRKFL